MSKYLKTDCAMYNKLRILLSACLFVPFFFAPLLTRAAETIDRITAVVNGDIITQSELDEVYEHSNGRNQFETRHAALEKMIDDLLLKQAIDKARVTVEDNELSRAIQNILRQNKMTADELKNELASKGTGFESYKNQIKDQIKFMKFTNQIIGHDVKITDRDLRDYYEKNKEQFKDRGFEAVKNNIYDILYDERVNEALATYLLKQRANAYIEIK